MATAAQDASRRKDPTNSPLWSTMVEQYLGVVPITFDDRVKVILPPVTEDQSRVPITIDARGLLGQVEEMLILADLNPFPLTIRFEPKKAEPFLAFRQKLEQGTAIHAAVKQNGEWRVGSAYLDAAGGGCSVRPTSKQVADLSNVGEIRGRVWPEREHGSRLRFLIDHPMDNGMISNIPAYFIETVEVSDPKGELLAKLTLSEAVAPNPVFTVITAEEVASDKLMIKARDNDGGDFRGEFIRSRDAQPIRQGSL